MNQPLFTLFPPSSLPLRATLQRFPPPLPELMLQYRSGSYMAATRSVSAAGCFWLTEDVKTQAREGALCV